MTYSLGSQPRELERLDRQAAAIARPTEMLLRAAGIGPRMRVLDLGTGLGHVAIQVAELVGPEGSVVGVDQAGEALEVARSRAGPTVRFEQADAREFHDPEPFDAIVMRLLLFHLQRPDDLVRHHLKGLRDGGVMLAIDFDIGGARTEPPVPVVEAARDWIEAGFRSAAADPRVGARLGTILRDAGFEEIQTIGLQSYVAPGDPSGPAMVAGVAHSLAARIAAEGIAAAEELEGLEERMAAALRDADAVLLLPTVAGAWARKRA